MRTALQNRGNRRKVPDATMALALREFEVEDLFFTRLRDQVARHRGRATVFTPEERKAWDLYKERAFSASTFQGAGQATAGADLVPTTLLMTILGDLAHMGPMADTSNMMNLSHNTVGDLEVPRVTGNDTLRAKILAENVDGAPTVWNTSKVTLTPRNTYVHSQFTDQMLLGGNANLRAFVDTDVPVQFGLSYNEWYTVGTGVGQPLGVTAITGRSKRIATTKVITEAELYEVVDAVKQPYRVGPGATVQAHPAASDR